jgi:hypothetical protein
MTNINEPQRDGEVFFFVFLFGEIKKRKVFLVVLGKVFISFLEPTLVKSDPLE